MLTVFQTIPGSDMVGILYWVFAGSLGAYYLFSWANQYIEASLVAAYTALQPVMTGIATYIALVSLFGGIVMCPPLHFFLYQCEADFSTSRFTDIKGCETVVGNAWRSAADHARIWRTRDNPDFNRSVVSAG